MSDTIWDDDVLGRRRVADDVQRVLAFGSCVIDVDAPYGCGKTFVLDRLQHQLNQSGYRCLKIDAWGTDYHTAPMLMIFGEFADQLGQLGLMPHNSSLAKSVKAVGKSLLKRGVPAVLKITTLGVIDVNDIGSELAKAQTDAVAEAAGKIGDDLVDEYVTTKKSIENFRASLTAAVASLSSGSILDKTRIVVIVDELDRCRPDYAIRILEMIKHLFAVDGVAFILGADMTALARSVAATYGIGTDAAAYLGRLIDYTIRIESSHEHPEQFAGHLATSIPIHLAEPKRENELVSMFAAATRTWLPTLRDQTRAFKTIGLTLRMKPHLADELLSPTVAFLCFKLYSPDFYRRYIGTNLPFGELFGHLTSHLTERSASELASQSHSFFDERMASRIRLIALLLAVQMVDDRSLRFAFEVGAWSGGAARPDEVAVLGNLATQLQTWTLDQYRRLEKVDADLYATMPLRQYLDLDLAVLS